MAPLLTPRKRAGCAQYCDVIDWLPAESLRLIRSLLWTLAGAAAWPERFSRVQLPHNLRVPPL